MNKRILNNIATTIARIEGKKSQAKIGDIREVLCILVDLQSANNTEDGPIDLLLDQAIKQKTKRKKK